MIHTSNRNKEYKVVRAYNSRPINAVSAAYFARKCPFFLCNGYSVVGEGHVDASTAKTRGDIRRALRTAQMIAARKTTSLVLLPGHKSVVVISGHKLVTRVQTAYSAE